MKLIDRLIIMEILPSFFFGVLAFTALILGVGALYQMIRLAIDYNADFLVVTQIFLLKLPEIISYTLPMSALFCVLLGFNRFSNDLEITAFRAAGIGFFRLLIPVLIFGMFVSVLSLLLSDKIVPMSNVRFNELVAGLEKNALQTVKQDNFTFIDKKGGEVKSIISAVKIEGTKLLGLSYMEMEHGVVKRMTTAREANWKDRTYWVFNDGRQIYFNSSGEPGNIVKFDEMNIIFSQNIEEKAREKNKAGDYSYRELRARIKLLEDQNMIDPNLRKMKVDFYSKLSIPFASFAFVLIAAPLGLKPQRASSSVGLGVSVIIIFLYYFVQQVFRGLGQSVIDPAVAAWLPNLILCIVGIQLVRNASK